MQKIEGEIQRKLAKQVFIAQGTIFYHPLKQKKNHQAQMLTSSAKIIG